MNDRRQATARRRISCLLPLLASAACLSLAGCQNGDPTRAGLEFRRVRVAPEVNVSETSADATSSTVTSAQPKG